MSLAPDKISDQPGAIGIWTEEIHMRVTQKTLLCLLGPKGMVGTVLNYEYSIGFVPSFLPEEWVR